MKDYNGLFKHCVNVREKDGRYMPVRFSEERLRLYAEEKPECPYSLCPIGISMEFITSAGEISFEYNATRVIYPVKAFDFYENGVFVDFVRPPDEETRGKIIYRKKTPGDVVIECFFPVGVDLEFFNFDFGDHKTRGDHYDSDNNRKKLLVAGDSISQGLFGVNPSLNYINLLARHYGMECLNLSVGGEIFRKGLIEEKLDFNPDRILLSLGTNDVYFLNDLNKISANVDGLFEELSCRFDHVPVDIVTPFWQVVFGTFFEEFPEKLMMEKLKLTRDVTAHVKKAAVPYGFKVHDGFDLIPHNPEFFSDHAHPNDKGFAVLALNLIKRLDW